ncbi:unnamed protein product [Meloidogyne enterolobii]|uniref:Uncharacterized protein n=1 Tax=Meloidogyne enterolobii TaxID=390850 RepID=A0ACB1B945_MELEN
MTPFKTFYTFAHFFQALDSCLRILIFFALHRTMIIYFAECTWSFFFFSIIGILLYLCSPIPPIRILI